MKKIFICSPLATYQQDTIEINIATAKYYCMLVIKQGDLPIAPHVYFTQLLRDELYEDREKGRRMGLELLKICQELYVFGDRISEGMKQEIIAWRSMGREEQFVIVHRITNKIQKSDLRINI